MPSYRVRTSPANAVPAFKAIEGEPVVIPGWEELHFFSHRSLGQEGITITEPVTGLTLTEGNTVEEALAKAITRLATSMPEHLRKVIADNQPQAKLQITITLDLNAKIEAEALKRKLTTQEYVSQILKREVGRTHHKK